MPVTVAPAAAATAADAAARERRAAIAGATLRVGAPPWRAHTRSRDATYRHVAASATALAASVSACAAVAAASNAVVAAVPGVPRPAARRRRNRSASGPTPVTLRRDDRAVFDPAFAAADAVRDARAAGAVGRAGAAAGRAVRTRRRRWPACAVPLRGCLPGVTGAAQRAAAVELPRRAAGGVSAAGLGDVARSSGLSLGIRPKRTR